MPSPEELPDDLSSLSQQHALEISDHHFHGDVDRLIRAVRNEPARTDRDAPRIPLVRALTQRTLFAVLAFGFLLGVGVLFAWRRSLDGNEASGAKVVAVLPFENLGAAQDEFIPDGITDEVRARLIALPGVLVIARGSSTLYKRTTKTPQQIADELGVRYLLTATVRWEKTRSGTRNLRVSAELMEVRRRGAPRIKWQHAFEGSVTDDSLAGVFQVYAEIGTRVAEALAVALVDSVRQQLAQRPTQNLAAYEAYLKGEEVLRGWGTMDVAAFRRAASYFGRAVALDSGFVQAWAAMSRVHSALYLNSTPSPAVAEDARRAAERALALAPNRAEGHLAMGFYYRHVVKDVVRAADETREGRRIAPNDLQLLILSASIEVGLGHWEAVVGLLRQAQIVDPRSIRIMRDLTEALIWLRRYPEAHVAGRAFARADPASLDGIQDRAMIYLAQGDLAGARAVIASVPEGVDKAALAAFFGFYWDLYWVLDDAQQGLLVDLAPSAFDDDRVAWALVLAQAYWLRGDRTRARVFADSARIAVEEQLRTEPNDAQRHIFRGLALAYLNQKVEAIQDGNRGVSLLPIAKDALGGAYLQHQLARIYILVGEPDKALDLLEPLLRMPYFLSPGWLKIDPNFDPLRNHPRFQRLVAGHS